jgi:DNA (cytosine-5)-methyltransferase 1
VLNVVDLFSGIGGFTLGLESTGYFKTIQFVENEKWCQKILNKNFSEVPIHEDIKTYKGCDADVVVGGFPCQPFSIAGKGKAIQDDRHLWPHMFRVIKETKPTWVIGENVRNIISISDGMVLEQVYLDLESEGYEVQSFIIPASAVNAPHQRYRTWIVAYSRRTLQSRTKLRKENENEVGKGYANQSERSSKTSESDVADTKSKRARENNEGLWSRTSGVSRGQRTSGTEEDVADTDSKGLQRTEQHETYNGETKTQYTTAKCFEEKGYYWEFEPNVGRVANGIPNRVDRLRGLGNAIVPQIAYQIGMAIKGAEEC